MCSQTMQPATVRVPWEYVSPFEPISLDRDAEVPLGTQLTWALRARITGGALPRGERLPGARELAAEVGVNVNTIRSVYARLEEEGLLAIVHGRGTFVADRPPPAREASRLAAEVDAEARRRGIDPRAVAAALYVGPGDGGHEMRDAPEHATGAAPGRETRDAPEPARNASSDWGAAADDAAIRRALRAQITGLERQLAKLPALGPDDDPLARPARLPEDSAGRLLTRQELEHARDRLAAQVAEAAERADGPGGDSPTPARAEAPAPAPNTLTRRGTLRWVTG